jgi:hypothetical protein
MPPLSSLVELVIVPAPIAPCAVVAAHSAIAKSANFVLFFIPASLA